MNEVYRIDVELRGSVEVLADSEEAATTEAKAAIEAATEAAADRGVYLRGPADIKARLVIPKEGV